MVSVVRSPPSGDGTTRNTGFESDFVWIYTPRAAVVIQLQNHCNYYTSLYSESGSYSPFL